MGIDPKARPWVLLPGTLCTGAVFDGFLDALGVPAAARTVIELTHPNIDDYADAFSRVTPETIVCGFSLGAIVTAHLADQLGATQIVLFGLNPHADDPAKRDGRLALARDVTAQGGAAALADRLPALAGSDPSAARAVVLAMADASAHDIAAHTALALERPGALGTLACAESPVVFLTGTDDTQAPLSMAEDAAKATPNSQIIPLPGLGHYALVEDAGLCAQVVTTVLEKA